MNYFERMIWADNMFPKAGLPASAMPHAGNARAWMERIENEMSPENLSCDGELRGAALKRKSVELQAAYRMAAAYLPTSSPMPNDGNQFMRFADQFSIRAQYNKARRARTSARMHKLDAAVQGGFTIGARVLISNGTTGTIIKINRTRVKVKGDDQRMWSVPPRCMELLKVR